MDRFQKWFSFSRNKKGASTLEIVIGLLIFLIVFCFLMDLLILTWKFSVIAQTTTEVARITGIQGGALGGPPNGYPGGYISESEMLAIIGEKFESAGIKSNEWQITGLGRMYDYKENFSIQIRVAYRWDFMSNILPFDLSQTITSKRPGMSEWKYNYGSWEGE